ncbi:hypothetical protein FA95DRAFT_1606296 [Auriscalpium vulgare]|uniref:Uncharacterized protein n=1 Tax=Auriscalpium vulgare TaxID=40419 RepID=A0ACB8RT56_9AGAM|nr:hypothetical protein FA95DRAFT_1606296 [Auriscalpium vulgare]
MPETPYSPSPPACLPHCEIMKDRNDSSAIPATNLAFIRRLSHVVLGLILWEIVTTCNHEIDVLLGRRHYLRTIWISVGCRAFMAVALTILIVIEAVVGLESCTAWDASIYIRCMAAAINRRGGIDCFVGYKHCAQYLVLDTLLMRSVNVQQTGECVKSERSIFSNIGVVTSNLGLLPIMLVGVLWHHADMLARPRGFSGIWGLLWHQVMDCLGLDGTVEVPTLVLILLNFDEPWDVTREIATLGTISIIAIRMNRVLANNQPGTDVDTPLLLTRATPPPNGLRGGQPHEGVHEQREHRAHFLPRERAARTVRKGLGEWDERFTTMEAGEGTGWPSVERRQRSALVHGK